MNANDIKKVLIVGSGTMGQQIGVTCAIAGLQVNMYDISEVVIDKSKERIQKLLHYLVKIGKLHEGDDVKAFSKISFFVNPVEAARDVDLVIENVPEDPKLKGEVFAQFNKLCPERTIFTTNTSTLLPSMFAQESGRPEKLVALHFHDIRFTDVVDVMPHPGSAKEVVEVVRDFAVRIGQNPIVMKQQSPGYVFNYMLSELFKSAQTLVANGVASVFDVDRAWMGVLRVPIGPFGMMDSIGLDTVWKITDYWAKKLNDPQMLKNAAFMKQYVDRGELGQKTQKGFYTYPNPEFTRVGFLKGIYDEELAR
ncbi:MAG: 3-hydroxyacyl-CoA dehydrogenase [Spirochaetes bacterium]|nr:3-hydroxyacyl-CoA dehydrogenase [Spirochaetota bacterium]